MLFQSDQIGYLLLMDSRKEVFVELLGGNDMNQVKADPDKDDENKRTLNSSLLAASPHWMMNMLTCSMVDVSSCLENLVKLGTFYRFGSGIRSYAGGYGVR